ncbi:hypothetical protein THAOC_17225 [Thalassiosira oceanica]|uniref:Uncharacterized protein n=1 Tax=Thalassiosira oceanica TaxID=159749 RepID=K0SAC4_THAOC|nr:hypothetical protein THAOC_17225 [Thalassiosira oceanica]|eukprot:EJK62175.1 hypothetical protein THAOC_17225 [Thalassiosira oceanica]
MFVIEEVLESTHGLARLLDASVNIPTYRYCKDIAADPSLGLLRWIGVAGLVGIGATVAELDRPRRSEARRESGTLEHDAARLPPPSSPIRT